MTCCKGWRLTPPDCIRQFNKNREKKNTTHTLAGIKTLSGLQRRPVCQHAQQHAYLPSPGCTLLSEHRIKYACTRTHTHTHCQPHDVIAHSGYQGQISARGLSTQAAAARMGAGPPRGRTRQWLAAFLPEVPTSSQRSGRIMQPSSPSAVSPTNEVFISLPQMNMKRGRAHFRIDFFFFFTGPSFLFLLLANSLVAVSSNLFQSIRAGSFIGPTMKDSLLKFSQQRQLQGQQWGSE